MQIDIDVVIPVYSLLENNDNYSEAFESLCQYQRDEPNDNMKNSESFKFKAKITGKLQLVITLEMLHHLTHISWDIGFFLLKMKLED